MGGTGRESQLKCGDCQGKGSLTEWRIEGGKLLGVVNLEEYYS